MFSGVRWLARLLYFSHESLKKVKFLYFPYKLCLKNYQNEDVLVTRGHVLQVHLITEYRKFQPNQLKWRLITQDAGMRPTKHKLENKLVFVRLNTIKFNALNLQELKKQ